MTKQRQEDLERIEDALATAREIAVSYTHLRAHET